MKSDSKRPDENLGIWYHEQSKDVTMGGRVFIPDDMGKWPDNWKKVEYKTYKNFKQVKLFPFSECKIEKTLSDALRDRKSFRDFSVSKKVISLKEISTFISNTISEKENKTYQKSLAGDDIVIKHRLYPSGGARFVLEFYFLVLRATDFPPGMYHYNVKEHSLEFLFSLEQVQKINLEIHYYPWAKDACVHVFTTAVVDRSYRKYGERGYKYICLEAGVVLENFYLVGSAIGLGTLAIAGVYDRNIEKMLYLDGISETLIQTFLLG